ncbi:MAG: PH domain-containing protein [Planctomycetota bacterium]
MTQASAFAMLSRMIEPLSPQEPAGEPPPDEGPFGIDPRWVLASRLAGLLSTLPIVLLGSTFVFMGLHRAFGIGDPLAWAMLGVLALRVPWRLVFPALAYPRWRYRLGGGVLEVASGVIVHRTALVPLNRIQHVDTEAGPIDRYYGLSNLIVKTAGTGVEAVAIPGLAEAEAQRMRDHLVRLGALEDQDAV